MKDGVLMIIHIYAKVSINYQKKLNSLYSPASQTLSQYLSEGIIKDKGYPFLGLPTFLNLKFLPVIWPKLAIK